MNTKKKNTRLELLRELDSVADERKAANLAWFFKTGKGEYGEGDVFLGIAVPTTRKIAFRYRRLPPVEIARLLASPIHEYRFAALEILVSQYEAADEDRREEIFDFYLQNATRVNKLGPGGHLGPGHCRRAPFDATAGRPG